MQQKKTIAAVFAVAMLATGCGAASSAGEAEEPPADAAGTRPSDDTLREVGRSLLGTAEDELSEDVRIGRRGGEQMMLTEDYVVGRYTVELDDDGTGTFRVSAVTVEMEDGPETFSA